MKFASYPLVLAIAMSSSLGCQTNKTYEMEKISMDSFAAGKNSVVFKSEGETLKGNLYLPKNFKPGQKLAAVVVTGSWTSVKEQMAGAYAQKLADQGYAALAFDFRYFGESSGKPRQYESPLAKIQDIKNAVEFLKTIAVIDANRIGGLGICASSGYMAEATAEDSNIKSMALVAPWFHNSALVKAVYGGQGAVDAKINSAKQAKVLFKETGGLTMVPAISTTDKNAAMFGEFDYYLNPKRGAIPEWKNQFAVQSWEDWLKFDGVRIGSQIKTPTLIVHSEQAAIPQGAKEFYAKLRGKKEIVWMDGSQFDFYDREITITKALALVVRHFEKSL